MAIRSPLTDHPLTEPHEYAPQADTRRPAHLSGADGTPLLRSAHRILDPLLGHL
jgi:hypothetical protein